MSLPLDFQKIADSHQQLRSHSCFQMAPELALKFAGIFVEGDYPYQNQLNWDRRGFEPYVTPFQNTQWTVDWIENRFEYPYAKMAFLLQAELKEKRYPIVSLLPNGRTAWHGYVVIEPIGSDDFLLVTKKGSLQTPPCVTWEDSLCSMLQNRQSIGYLTWKATKKQLPQNFPTP